MSKRFGCSAMFGVVALFLIGGTPTRGNEAIPCVASVTPLGGELGGSLAFEYSFNCRPNHVAVTFLSMTGNGVDAPLMLPGGMQVGITADAMTLALLAVPALSIARLDADGQGKTGAFELPEIYALQGIPMWVAGVAYDAGTLVAVEVTSTVSFALS